MSKFAKIALSACCFGLAGLAGCSEESGVKEQTQVTGPGGTTTVTKETKVETSGNNAPGASTTPGAGTTTTTPGDSTKTTP